MSLQCKLHPAYGSKRPPRSGCQTCWWLWFHNGSFDVAFKNNATPSILK